MQISTTCPYCGVGCGVTVEQRSESLPLLVTASDSHPANFGRVCSKGSALAETLDLQLSHERLTHPTIDGEVASWANATSEIAKRIQHCIDEHGSNSVAFYLSGQLLTEDYYVANKFAKGFLGTANVDTNSRLCMSSAVAAYKRAFGADAVPCSYEDLELADLLVLVGSNAAWTHPVLYQRMVQAKQDNPNLKVVLIDPRKTATADLADLHLAIRPSSDNFLFQGLLNFLVSNELHNPEYIAAHTEGFEELRLSVQQHDIQSVAERCQVSVRDLKEFYALFARTKKTVSFYSQGINQSSSGTDKCNAIINCHLATGKLGYEGAGPFSITGQPNAMGGREVGGLANMLAAHMDFNPEDIDRVERFWSASSMATSPGMKAVDMFDAIDRGDIKLVWIMATNPAVSLPNSVQISRALKKCDTVIVSDVTNTDTTRHADILLPALAWGEKDGTVTNSERRISRQRGFTKARGVAKPDWWAIAEVAKKMGFGEEFSFDSPHEVFAEHAALSAFENEGKRDFDLSVLADISAQSYDSLKPIQWPVNQENPNGTKRLFADGRFFTPSGKAQFIASHTELALSVVEQTDKTLLLNTGRLRDQWHTMTRTGAVPRLNAHDDVATVQVNPADALMFGLVHNGIAEVENELGSVRLLVKIDEAVKAGEAFAPIHWNDQFGSNAVVNTLVPSVVDPVSGQPEFKASRVTVRPMLAKSWARVVTLKPIRELDDFVYWSRNQSEAGYVYLLGIDTDLDWRALLDVSAETPLIEYANPIKKSRAHLYCESNKIVNIVFEKDCASQLPSYSWLINVMAGPDAKTAAGALRGEVQGQDSVVCACFGTTHKAIDSAIKSGVNSSSDLASSLGCGSKCGSCKPELNAFFT